MLYVRILPPVSTGRSCPAWTQTTLTPCSPTFGSPADALVIRVALPAAEGAHEVDHDLPVLQQRLHAAVRRGAVADPDDLGVAEHLGDRRAHHRPDVRDLLLDELLVGADQPCALDVLVVDRNRDALAVEQLDQRHYRRLAKVIGAGLEAQPE